MREDLSELLSVSEGSQGTASRHIPGKGSRNFQVKKRGKDILVYGGVGVGEGVLEWGTKAKWNIK